MGGWRGDGGGAGAESPRAAARQSLGASSDFLRPGSPRHHRRRHVRVWHADRQPFSAAQSRLPGSHGRLSPRRGQSQGAVGDRRLQPRLFRHAETAAAELRAPRRRNRGGGTCANWHPRGNGKVGLSHADYDRVAGDNRGVDANDGVGASRGVGTNRDVGTNHGVGTQHAAGSGTEAAARPRALRFAGGALSAAALALCIFVARRFGGAYLAGRVSVLIATLLVATAIVFVIVQVVPGDPVRYMMGLQADPDAVAATRHQLGLDIAPTQRYFRWLGGLLRGDFGRSFTYRIPVGELIADRLQVSLPLAVLALLLSAAIAFPIGFIAAARRGRAGDLVLSFVTQLGLAIPNFWLGILLVMGFAVGLHWVSPVAFPRWDPPLAAAPHALTLPAIALAMPQAAILARVLRGALIDTLHEDYIRTARAKGAGEWQVVLHHAPPHALVPGLPNVGMRVSFLLARLGLLPNVFFCPA